MQRRQLVQPAQQQSLRPSDMGQLIQLLEAGLSLDAQVRKPAEAMLETWKDVPGYFSLLKELIVACDAPAQTRLLGAMCFKNAIKRSWRKSRHNSGGVGEDERVHLRQHVLEFLDVSDTRISKQVSEIVSQIARYEFPAGWPELFPGLLARVQSYLQAGTPQSMEQLRAVVRTLKSVVRTLVSKKLPQDKRAFAELAPSIFCELCKVWSPQSEAFCAGFGSAGVQGSAADTRHHAQGKVVLYC
eukprot:SAG11_NODE_9656_length_892_cov_0.720050_1_plen_242_part_10